MNELPIIIFHIGNQPYVRDCLEHALINNKNIIIINERDNMYPDLPIKCVSYHNYNKLMNNFNSLYKHFSTNSQQLEFICIIRWMCVYEYMKSNNIERAFICDSDVLIYDNITKIDNQYLSTYEFMLCSSGSKNVTGGQSIWNIESLNKFILFIFKFYTTQSTKMEEWYKSYNEPGGVCDMTLLYYFSHNATEFVGLRLPGFPYFENDLMQIFDNSFTFDLHMGVSGNHIYPEDYEMNENRKKIKMIDNQPYCYCKRLDKDIRFILLHFQGQHKKVMPNYKIT